MKVYEIRNDKECFGWKSLYYKNKKYWNCWEEYIEIGCDLEFRNWYKFFCNYLDLVLIVWGVNKYFENCLVKK